MSDASLPLGEVPQSLQQQPFTFLPPYLAQILGFMCWGTCKVKRCEYDMVEADSHLKPLSTPKLDNTKSLTNRGCTDKKVL